MYGLIGLLPHEVNEMNLHFEQAITAPDSTRVTIKYYEAGTATDPDDTIYKVDGSGVSAIPVEVPGVRCLQRIVTPEDVKGFPNGMLQVGWCIFYFSTDLNLAEPLAGHVPLPDTLVIVDPDKTWEPKKFDNGAAVSSLIFRLGDIQVGQPILCQPKL